MAAAMALAAKPSDILENSKTVETVTFLLFAKGTIYTIPLENLVKSIENITSPLSPRAQDNGRSLENLENYWENNGSLVQF